MKSCKKCGVAVGDKYELCFPCFNAERGGPPIEEAKTSPATRFAASATTGKPGSWDPDPLIDILMKINSNLGKIAQAIEKTPVKSTESSRIKESDLFDG